MVPKYAASSLTFFVPGGKITVRNSLSQPPGQRLLEKLAQTFGIIRPPIPNAAEDACPLTRSYSRREMQHCKRRDGDQQRTNNLSLVHKPVKRGNSGV
jgi:hypothetical protein